MKCRRSSSRSVSAPAGLSACGNYRTGLLFWDGMPELRNDKRFVRLCARLGLIEFWTATNKWPDCVDDVPYEFKAECARARDIPKEEFGF